MYVRDAKNREEVWLLDRLEELGLDDPAFRSRDYVVAIDETTNEKAGFGRIQIHPGEPEVCELSTVGVLSDWRGQGVGAHIIERLLAHASDAGFEVVYAVTGSVEYLTQFGFTPVHRSDLPPAITDRLDSVRERNEDALALALDPDAFEVPDHLRDAFKQAGRVPDDEHDDVISDEADALREEFGIDPDTATYKYDTGR